VTFSTTFQNIIAVEKNLHAARVFIIQNSRTKGRRKCLENILGFMIKKPLSLNLRV